MYFSLDPHDTAALTSTLRQAFKAGDGSDAQISHFHYLALLDNAFDYENRPLKWHSEAVPVYGAAGHLAALNNVSPTLYSLSSPHSTEFEAEIRRVSRHCNGRPMLSFLRSQVSAEELSEQWQKCLLLTTKDDSEPYLLRFADSRILPALSTMPDTPIWQILTQSVSQWLIVGRTGTIQALPLPEQESAITFRDQQQEVETADVEITDKGLQHLLMQGQPDSVINVMAEQFPEMMPKREHALFYERIAQACKLAEKVGIDAFPEVLALAMATHLSQGQILKNTQVIHLLQERQWPSGQLSEVLNQYIPEEVL